MNLNLGKVDVFVIASGDEPVCCRAPSMVAG